jgi:uncharacterized protein YgiM (DUF1202 family)
VAAAPVPEPRFVYVRTHRANVRETAGARGRILAVLRKGDKVIVLDEQRLGANNLWYRVKLEDGREGWMGESVTAPKPGD